MHGPRIVHMHISPRAYQQLDQRKIALADSCAQWTLYPLPANLSPASDCLEQGINSTVLGGFIKRRLSTIVCYIVPNVLG